MGQNIYAFPTHPDIPTSADGMALRDYFAAKAMQTLVSNYHNGQSSMRHIAEDAYDMADLMMKVRLDSTDDTDT